jgi:hypothetical protein
MTEYGKTSLDSEISIVKPKAHVYIFNIQIAPLPGQGRFNAIVIGAVNVEVDIGNTSADKVEFYVDNELKDNDTEAPYEWKWDDRMIVPRIHSLKVVGYENDVEVGSDEIRLLFINPLGFLYKP